MEITEELFTQSVNIAVTAITAVGLVLLIRREAARYKWILRCKAAVYLALLVFLYLPTGTGNATYQWSGWITFYAWLALLPIALFLYLISLFLSAKIPFYAALEQMLPGVIFLLLGWGLENPVIIVLAVSYLLLGITVFCWEMDGGSGKGGLHE